MIRYEVLADADRFYTMGEWQHLWTESKASVFQSRPWLYAWYDHIALNDRLRQVDYDLAIGLAWDEKRLIAVLPMAVHHFKGIRLLEWAGQSLCDYCDGFGDAEQFPALWEKILTQAKPDIIRLKNVGPEAKIRPFLEQSGLRAQADDLCLLIRS